MCSPPVSEDWVAIKEFPFFSLDENARPSGGRPTIKSDQSSGDCWDGKQHKTWTFSVDWIDDINVIQLKCERQTEKSKHLENSENNNEASYISEFSVEKLSGIHQQICLMCPLLVDALPDLPLLPKGSSRIILNYICCIDTNGRRVSDNTEEEDKESYDVIFFNFYFLLSNRNLEFC